MTDPSSAESAEAANDRMQAQAAADRMIAGEANNGLGPLDPYLMSEETGFLSFRIPDLGVHGLAKVAGRRVDILAVASNDENAGHFRAFIERLKARNDYIGVWAIGSNIVHQALVRYGFRGARARFKLPFDRTTVATNRTETVEGMAWKR